MGWSVILGASEGTGAAIARAVSRDPGLSVFAVHRGRHPEAAALLEQDLRASGHQVALRAFDAGTPEGAESGASQLLEIAGPGSVELFVHSITGASLGLFTGEGEKNLSPARSTAPSTPSRTPSSSGRRSSIAAACSRRERACSASPTRSASRSSARAG
jgi:NAD(P)-dependent dehydrogenase (short-subunit alcohol dehydrogenase family)